MGVLRGQVRSPARGGGPLPNHCNGERGLTAVDSGAMQHYQHLSYFRVPKRIRVLQAAQTQTCPYSRHGSNELSISI